MRVHLTEEGAGGGTYSEISVERFMSLCDLGKIFRLREGETITDIYLTGSGTVKAKFAYTNVVEREEGRGL